MTGKHVGKRFFAPDFDLGPNLPTVSEVVAIEGSQGAEGLVDGRSFEFSLCLEMEEEVEDRAALESGQVLARIMVLELSDPSEV